MSLNKLKNTFIKKNASSRQNARVKCSVCKSTTHKMRLCPAVLQLKKRMQKQRKRKHGSAGDAGDAALPWYSRSNFQSKTESSDESGSSSSEPDGDEIDYESQSLEESSEGSLVEFVVPDTDFN
jgi:hypothetical protein